MLFRSAWIGFLGAIVGGTIVWVGQTGSFNLQPGGMSYSDLAATLLAAAGLLVAIIGVALALAAFWGFRQLKKDAIRAAQAAGVVEIKDQITKGDIRDSIISAAHAAGSAEIKDQITSGDIRDFIKREIERLTDEEFSSPRMNERINRRVDAVAFGRPDKDSLLDDEGDEQ